MDNKSCLGVVVCLTVVVATGMLQRSVVQQSMRTFLVAMLCLLVSFSLSNCPTFARFPIRTVVDETPPNPIKDPSHT